MSDISVSYTLLITEKVSLKRLPRQPKVGYFLARESEPETIQPTPYVDLV